MHLSLILLCLQLLGSVDVSLSQDACSQLPVVPHSSVSEETKKAEYEKGDVIHFKCEVGYISGPTIRYVCTANGWEALRQGTCYLKPCELPDDTPNGYYEIIQGEEFVFGTIIKYFCNEGYQMTSKYDTRTCLLDRWTNHVPVCEPSSCDPPPTDGVVTVKGLPLNDEPILSDRFLRFSCDDPGKYLNGSSVLTCGSDGQWDNPVPSCEDITCEVGLTSAHLNAVGLPPANEAMVGHKIQFYCDDQYALEGSAEVECLQTGRWNADFPSCNENCKVPDQSQHINFFPNAYRRLRKGGKLTFSCHKHGHVLQGKAVVECLGNGQWSDPFPTCEAPLGCGKPPILTDGDITTVSKWNYAHNERVEYRCQNLYIMEGGPFKTCVNGEWTGQIRCIEPCTVDGDLMRAHNIGFKHGSNEKLYAPHNDHITFSCTRGRRHDGRLSMRQQCVDGVMHLPTCI